jgi:acetyl-CoA/propionyl-CoA carboxylase, biotin carboxylase, biotin carboxyl carrier protein
VVPGGPPPARPGPGSAAARTGSGSVRSPMQGRVVAVLVEVGAHVQVNQPVCVIEAMKMESTLVANRAGPVLEVTVTPGQAVRAEELVVLIGEATEEVW